MKNRKNTAIKRLFNCLYQFVMAILPRGKKKMKNVSCNCIHRNLSNRMQFKEHGEIAEVLAVSVSTVKNWLRTEVLPSHEIAGIRFVSRETIDRLVSGGFDDNQSAA